MHIGCWAPDLGMHVWDESGSMVGVVTLGSRICLALRLCDLQSATNGGNQHAAAAAGPYAAVKAACPRPPRTPPPSVTQAFAKAHATQKPIGERRQGVPPSRGGGPAASTGATDLATA